VFSFNAANIYAKGISYQYGIMSKKVPCQIETMGSKLICADCLMRMIMNKRPQRRFAVCQIRTLVSKLTNAIIQYA